MQNKKGIFFVLEGLDGSGKTEVINRLKTEMPNMVYTREPGGTPFAEKIREVLLADVSKNVPALPMLLGFMCSRASHVEELVLPNIQTGVSVVSDRLDASTFAFQLFGQEHRDLEDNFWYIRSNIFRDICVHYIYLKISPELARLRRGGRNESNHFDDQVDSYHGRVFEGYENFFEKIKQRSDNFSGSYSTVHTVDASDSKENVYQQVLSYIKSILEN